MHLENGMNRNALPMPWRPWSFGPFSCYPDKDIPADKYFRAYQMARSKKREPSSVLTAGSIWSPIGPTNLQGRALSVALNPLNPNTVYVGTASGGLWRSYTGGLGGDWLK